MLLVRMIVKFISFELGLKNVFFSKKFRIHFFKIKDSSIKFLV